jgi:CRISPR-associated protein (TIGR03986 family)
MSPKFINPYNFVPLAKVGKGYRTPVPRSAAELRSAVRYTGRIRCLLRTLSPFFTPDPETLTVATLREGLDTGEDLDPDLRRLRFPGAQEGHKIEDYFAEAPPFTGRVRNPRIPGSSLRGALRSLCETFSNGCLSILRDDYMEFRDSAYARDLRPACVVRMPGDDGPGELQLLEEALVYVFGGEPTYHGCPRLNDKVEKLAESRPQRPVAAIVRRVREGIRPYRVQDLAAATSGLRRSTTEEMLLEPWSGDGPFLPGQAALRCTGETIGNKHFERVFFLPPSVAAAASGAVCGVTASFSRKQAEEYDRVVRGQFERARQAGGAPFKTRLPDGRDHSLEVGTLVYVQMEDKAVVRLCTTSFPRMSYKRSVFDCVPEALRPCGHSRTARLTGLSADAEAGDTGRDLRVCPTCRVFGMVAGALEGGGRASRRDAEEDAESAALAGRVSISDARFLGLCLADEDWPGGVDERAIPRPLRWETLQILGTPHPTAVEFYLYDPEDPSRFISRDRGYDDKGKVLIRGRKHYWHHGEEPKYRRTDGRLGRDDREYSIQNSTIRALEPGHVFEFTISFRDLTLEELGMVLYPLVLERELAWKLGRGKPLGMGSVWVVVDGLEVFDLRARYGAAGGPPLDTDELRAKAIAAYKRWIASVTGDGRRAFEELDHVIQARRMLRFSKDGEHLPHEIAYPRQQEAVTRHYEWFMENRRRHGDTLPTVSEVVEDTRTLRRPAGGRGGWGGSP